MRVLIVGLGRLGSSLVDELSDTNVELLVIDKSPLAVDAVKDRVSAAFVADGTDPAVLESIGVGDLDVAVVTYGEDFEASVLAVASLVQAKVKRVLARGANERQAMVLRAVGATRVILVEDEMGRRLAPEVMSPASSDLIEYASSFRVVPWSPAGTMVGKTLAELDLRKRHEITVLGYWRASEGITGRRPRPTLPGPDYRVASSDTLLIIGLHSAVEKFLAST